MKRDVHLKGQLKLYMQWPVFMAMALIAMNIWIYLVDRKAGFMMSFFVVVYILITVAFYLYNKSHILADLVEFAVQYGFVQNVLLKELSIPYAILQDDGKLIWVNDIFVEMLGDDIKLDTYMSKYIQELNRSVFPKTEKDKVELGVSYLERDYKAVLSLVPVRNIKNAKNVFQLPKGKEYFITLTLHDVTEHDKAIQEKEEQRLVSGLIYIDNYEEVMGSVEEVRQSLLVALIDRKVNQYMANFDAIVKKMEKDKYFFVMKKKYFCVMEKGKFTILEEARSVSVGNTMPVTLSIGIGITPETYVQSYNYARVAIDLALARGGNQVVVKQGKNITYYGGKREQLLNNTRVKARVKAEALREFIMAKDQVVVMGHKIADVDSFGAAIGIYRAARMMEKKAYIMINEITSSVRPFYNGFVESSAYPNDMFIQSDDLDEIMTDNTMAVVVDTNRLDMTDCPNLLKRAKTIVVFDHHRQSSDIIENTVLSYIEPYASSACEMVAEVLQYIADDMKMTNMEANIMYAGIMIDTNNFANRTGVRTFEAAAYLRRCGADIAYVKKIFRDDIESYRVKAAIISGTEVYRKQYAIASFRDSEIDSPTVIGAQVANELLNIDEIRASFVLTEYNEQIYVSARSIDEINVQIIMERMGGGGHINSAGCQFPYTNMDEAIAILKETIDIMMKEGDI